MFSVKWTPLHASLGLEETELTFEIAASAIEGEVVETQELDFKRDLPLALPPGAKPEAKDQKQSELAKDVAAMANSGGGLLLYGMDEDRQVDRSVAKRICSVGALDETVEKQIRQVVANLAYPAVRELEFAWLIEQEPIAAGEPRSMLALLVPDSIERPHLIHPRGNNKEWFMSPYRDGRDTAFMTDRMLQSAYIDRERGERRLKETFEARFADLLTLVPGDGWIVVMASPARPSTSPAEFTQYEAEQIFRSGFAGSYGGLRPNRLSEEQTRIGLRRFSRRHTSQATGGQTIQAYVEVHQDGAVALAFNRGGDFPDIDGRVPQGPVYRRQVAIDDIYSVLRDLAQVLWAARKVRGSVGSYRARLAMPGVTHFRRKDPGVHGAFQRVNEERDRVVSYRPIEGWLSDAGGDTSVLEGLLALLVDAHAQAGASAPPLPEAKVWLAEFLHLTRHLPQP